MSYAKRLYSLSMGNITLQNTITPGNSTNVTSFTGPTGPTGTIDYTLVSGEIGPTGYTGYTGYIGPTGYTGETGPIGSDGLTGYTGPIGPTGPPGSSSGGVGSNYWSSTDNNIYYNDGNVGIGTNNPAYTLDIIGSVNATNVNATSDYRIKESIIPLDDSFNVDNLFPIFYKNIQTNKHDIGLIAHELQNVYPFLVNGVKDGENLQSINYIGLIGILIREIKELKEKVKKMENNSFEI